MKSNFKFYVLNISIWYCLSAIVFHIAVTMTLIIFASKVNSCANLYIILQKSLNQFEFAFHQQYYIANMIRKSPSGYFRLWIICTFQLRTQFQQACWFAQGRRKFALAYDLSLWNSRESKHTIGLIVLSGFVFLCHPSWWESARALVEMRVLGFDIHERARMVITADDYIAYNDATPHSIYKRKHRIVTHNARHTL
jgi:hypothetical protein